MGNGLMPVAVSGGAGTYAPNTVHTDSTKRGNLESLWATLSPQQQSVFTTPDANGMYTHPDEHGTLKSKSNSPFTYYLGKDNQYAEDNLRKYLMTPEDRAAAIAARQAEVDDVTFKTQYWSDTARARALNSVSNPATPKQSAGASFVRGSIAAQDGDLQAARQYNDVYAQQMWDLSTGTHGETPRWGPEPNGREAAWGKYVPRYVSPEEINRTMASGLSSGYYVPTYEEWLKSHNKEEWLRNRNGAK